MISLTLSGLLPICASCKKIRDDKGYWHQVETYIEDYSEALFSHSLCPECVKDIYGEFGELDLKEFITGLSLLCKGTVEEKLRRKERGKKKKIQN